MQAVTNLSVAAAQKLKDRGKKARRQVAVMIPLVVAVAVVNHYRNSFFGSAWDTPVRVISAIALVALGWWVARDAVRAASPVFFKRLEPATAGTVSFLMRLVLLGAALLFALRTAGLDPRALAVGGAFTAVIVGLAAQNTLGNVMAGMLLISARPFKVGDRVRFQAGGVAGQIEGVVMSLGLLYVTLTRGEDTIMIPNNVAMSAAIVPLREPTSVDLRARVKPDVKPSELQKFLEEQVTVPTRSHPHISVEEVDDDEVVMRVAATPELDREGAQLADEILAAIGQVTGRNGNGRSNASDN